MYSAAVFATLKGVPMLGETGALVGAGRRGTEGVFTCRINQHSNPICMGILDKAHTSTAAQ
jgi:hypothetical protein